MYWMIDIERNIFVKGMFASILACRVYAFFHRIKKFKVFPEKEKKDGNDAIYLTDSDVVYDSETAR